MSVCNLLRLEPGQEKTCAPPPPVTRDLIGRSTGGGSFKQQNTTQIVHTAINNCNILKGKGLVTFVLPLLYSLD